MKLDVFSNSLDDILRDHFTALVMRAIDSTDGFEESKKHLVDTMRYNYGAMMLDKKGNAFDELYSYYPLWYDDNKALQWYDPDWLTNFSSPLRTESGREAWEVIVNCTQSSTKLPKSVSCNQLNRKKKISKFDCCFMLHATEEVKVAVEGAGEYHRFILDKALTEQRDQVTIINR